MELGSFILKTQNSKHRCLESRKNISNLRGFHPSILVVQARELQIFGARHITIRQNAAIDANVALIKHGSDKEDV